MQKLQYVQLTGMTLAGFKCYPTRTELTFGNPTVITGGNRQSNRAFLTEGPLKGDVTSYLANDALFVCTGGVNAIHGLKETIQTLGVTEVVEAMDMDQMTNPHVRQAVQAMRQEVQAIPGIHYSKYTWNPAYKGVDDYLLSRRQAG